MADIFFIDISSIPDRKNGKTHRRFSREVLSTILSEKYGITSDISETNGKPYLKTSDMKFSISHSENIIAIAFDKDFNLGFDIEYKRERDYSKILKYYGQDFDKVSQKEFYQAWTIYEAEYKLGELCKYKISFEYKNYICSLACSDRWTDDITIYELGIDEAEKVSSIAGRKLSEVAVLPDTRIRIK